MAMTGGTSVLLKTTYPFTDKSKPLSLYAYYKSTQNVDTNESTVLCGMYVVTPSSAYDIGPWQDNRGSYIGTTANTFNGAIPNFGGTRWLTENQSFKVKHDDSGMATANIFWKWGVNSPWGGFEVPSGFFPISLPTIARASVPVLPSKIIIGADNLISVSAGSSNFTHDITYSFNGKTGKVTEERVKGGVVWWTPPYDLASTIPSATSGEGTITCTTYNGTTVVGTKTVPFTATVPDNETTKPSFTDDGFALAPSGNIPSAFSGLYIQGKTGVKATFTASSDYSNIASYKLSADGRVYTGNPAESQVLTKDGDIEVIGTVYDTRGYYTQRSKTIKVHPYRTPTIEPYDGASSVICERSDGSKNYKDSGTYLHIKAKRSYAPIEVDGTKKNKCDFQYRYRMEGGSWSSRVTILQGSDTSTDLVDVELTDVVTQTDKSYEVELIVTDTMGATDSYSFPIGTDKVTFHLREGGLGAAFGKYSEGRDNLLECDWDFEVSKGLYANHIAMRSLYDGLDFNELIYHTGYYASNSAPGAAGCSNYPIDQTGVLEVISQITVNASTGTVWGFAYQTYRTHAGKVYVRGYYSDNGWSPWTLLTASAI